MVQTASPKLVRSPLYIQLKQILTELVKSDEFKVGDKFLTERQISERFDVSRATANKALSSLVQEGGLVGWRKASGWGMRPRTRPDRSQMPAMAFCEPLGLAGKSMLASA